MLPLNRAHKLPQISQISQSFPPSTSPANLQPKLLGFGSMSPHKPDLMACFFSRMVSLWRVIPATWPWVGSQIPNKGNQLKWDIFKKNDLFFPIFWNVKNQSYKWFLHPSMRRETLATLLGAIVTLCGLALRHVYTSSCWGMVRTTSTSIARLEKPMTHSDTVLWLFLKNHII